LQQRFVLEISKLIIQIVKRFGSEGGGKPGFVTAGGMTADIKLIREVVEKELTALLDNRG